MHKLLEEYKDIEHLYQVVVEGGPELRIHLEDGINLERELASRDLNYVCSWEASYPLGLQGLPGRPLLLFYAGQLNSVDIDRCVSIVGTRSCSEQSLLWTSKIVQELASRKYTIVSGMAMGVDAEAHRAALKFNTQTLAVLASPPDIPTPTVNTHLHERILTAGGLVMSEYIQPEINKSLFVQRNRIIAGLSKATIVIQAGEGSGALHTAMMAAKYGRKVLALSGGFDHKDFAGNHGLIRSGKAVCVADVQDVLSELDESQALAEVELAGLTATQLMVLESLRGRPKFLEELRFDTRGENILSLLTSLELSGAVVKLTDGRYQCIV